MAGKPGRKRKSMGDSKPAKPAPGPAASEAKRKRRKSAPKETTSQASHSSEENGIQWLPKGKNWDKEVKAVDTIVREGEAGLMAWLEFNNGRKAKLSVQACYEKCPLKVFLTPCQNSDKDANHQTRCLSSTNRICELESPNESSEFVPNVSHSVFKDN